MTRTAIRIAVVVAAAELVLDLFIAIGKQNWHLRDGQLWWIDFVICPLFGLALVFAARASFPAAVVLGAAVGLIDGSIGYLIARVVEARHEAMFFYYGITFHPFTLATLTAAGAGLAIGARAAFKKSTVV